MRSTRIIAAISLACFAITARADITTLFLDNGFEDDTAGAALNAPSIGTWTIAAQTTDGVAIVTNDVVAGPFSATNAPYAGTNFLRIHRSDGGQNSARIDAVFNPIAFGNSITATFSFFYESTGDSSPAIRLMYGTQARVLILAESDLARDPYFAPTNFYTLDGNLLNPVYSSLPITPGAWQTIKIDYTAGSTNLTLTVNGTTETLIGSVTGGVVDRIRFDSGNTNTLYYIDGDITVTTTNTPPAKSQIIFQDDFQSDVAGTSITTDDLDPIIGLGDIGGVWDIRDGSTANHLPLAVQVLNDTVPDSQNPGVAGTNNYIRIYRGGSINFTGKAYATGWATEDTTDHVVQLDMKVWQEQLPSSIGPGYLSVMFGGAPQNNTSQSAWLNSVSTWIELADTNDVVSPPIFDFPDNQWNTVRIRVNLSSTTTQFGIPPQQFELQINDNAPTNGTFWTAHNTVQSVLVGVEGSNEHFDFIDDVTIQLLSDELKLLLTLLPDNSPQLTFTGSASNTYVVQISSNLTDWVSVSTNMADANGQFILMDESAANHPQRFYRGLRP
jgi:hypothetical protein